MLSKYSRSPRCCVCSSYDVRFQKKNLKNKKIVYHYCSERCGSAEINLDATDFLDSSKYNTIDDFFYDALNGERDWTAPSRLHPTMYGEYKVTTDLRWRSTYSSVGIKNPSRFLHEDKKTFKTLREPSGAFEMAYDVWEPKNTDFGSKKKLATIVLTNGVPVNRREWYAVARILSRFCRVITVDLFGMGDSSKPLNFKRPGKEGKWYWSLKMHSDIFKKMFDDWRGTHPEWFIDDKIFHGGNDWGGGAVQKFIEHYGKTDLHGGSFNSTIGINGFWVQHIGSMRALSLLPYPSPTFTAEAIRFAGVLTGLLETMFHRTSEIHNQYTMAPLQDPYVEISYDDPSKNPANTIYKEHAIRVLAEQASYILGNGELLPRHSIKNPGGIEYSKWDVPILSIWGRNDKMMPEGQLERYSIVISRINKERMEKGISSNLYFRKRRLFEAGHFAVSDQPEESADAILDWMMDIVGYWHFNRPYLGLTSLARQDEKHVLKMFDKF